ncbi:hypothetical protein SAMN05192562_10544 [Kosakonia arachidis]|uniref:Uncharacterized protein n=1 Tax=Kosakonia arachidis TaxID=551989 RepID=A0A1I7DGG5_9ENTR|nr:hypothetical protein SAMN05192562_10544 [Kosakonia arachidis]
MKFSHSVQFPYSTKGKINALADRRCQCAEIAACRFVNFNKTSTNSPLTLFISCVEKIIVIYFFI